MKKRITFLMAALLLACGLSWAQTTDVLNHDVIGVNGTSYSTWTGIISNSDAVYAGNTAGGNNAIQMRSKNNNSGIITTASGGVVTKVTIEWNDNTAEGRTLNVYGKNSAYSAATDLYNNQNQGTLIGTIVCGTSTELIFEDEYEYIGMRSADGAMYLDEVDIIWENGTAANDPTITADNVSIEYDATSGSIAYVINNGVEDGVLSAEVSSNSTIEEFELDSVGASPITFSCLTNETTAERTATVTLTYTYGDDQTVSKNVIVTQAAAPAPALPNIAALTALTDAGDYAVTLTDAVVTYNNGNYAYIQDASGAVVYYKNGHGLTAGDVLNGTATVTYQVRNSNPQITNLTDVTPVSGTAPEPTEVASSAWDYTFGNVLSQYFKVTGATITQNGSKYYVSLGGEDIQLYKASGAISGLNLDKTYSITGFPTMYNTTKELQIFDNPVEEASTEPSITIAPAMVEVDAEEHDGTLDLAYENLVISDMTDFDIQYYDAEGEETETPDWIEVLVAEQDPEIGEGYVVSYYMFENEGEARSAYFKVFASGDEDFVYSNLVTVNQDAYVAPALDYAELPFEFNGGKADIEGTDGLTAEGLGNDYNSAPKLRFDGTGDWLLLHFEGVPGKLAFDIKGNSFSEGTFTVQTSEDGETYTDFATYTVLDATEHEVFNNLGEDVRYIKWIYTEKVNGNVALGNIVLLQYTEPEEYSLTIDNPENVTITASYGTDGVLTNGESASILEGTEISLVANVTEGYVFEGFTVTDDEDNEISLTENDGVYSFHMPSSNVTVSATAVEDVPATPGTWVLTDLADLTENDVFVIVGTRTDETYGGNYAMPNDNGTSAPAAVAVTVVEGTLSGEPATNLQWNLGITDDGYIFYPNGTTETWLYCTNTNNGVRVGTNADNVFTMSENGYLHNTATGRYIGIYNSQDWRCYTSEGGNIANQTFAFYKKVETLPANSIVIEGYGESEGGYYLIASPFTVSPEDVQGMTEGEYDLYSFDEAEENEWRNYKAGAFTNLEPGKGYLYAHSTTVTLTFDGEAYNDEPIVLKKTAGGDFPGWNLVGNPYTETAYIDRDFYVMNPQTGDEIITGEGNEIAAMQGFFVIADHDGEELEISTEPTEEGGKIVMNVNSNRGNIIDRAMIRFGEGRQLPKFMLNEDNTKLYIAKGEEEYAVARNEAKGEMNLNFEAAKDGTYTLDFTVENVELDQLLLIDNKTGMSIDLLSNQSYTFEATTDDAAARFRIVFGATTSVQEENINKFAFYNNGNLIINNNGNAILNIVDVLGRIISSYNINGSENVSINAKAGVYMLQLIQGDKIQTQKIVVE